MFRGQHKECNPVDRVWASGEHRDLFLLPIDLGYEAYLGSFATSYPIALHSHGLFGPLHNGKVQQALRVIGDFQQPLVDLFANNGATTAFTGAIGQNLLVRQNGIATWTPVGWRLGAIGQAVLVELQEQPLCPLVIVRQAGDYFTLPVPLSAHHTQLFTHFVDVGQCPGTCLYAVFDGGILRRQAKGIETDGLHNVIALHAFEAPRGVEGRVVVPVAHVQVAGRVGKHNEMIEFWPGRVIGGVIELFCLPLFLPFLFNCFWIVLCACYHKCFPLPVEP